MKKILVIVILGMFLLTSFMATARINTDATAKVEKQKVEVIYDLPGNRCLRTPKGDVIIDKFSNSNENTQQGTTGDGPDIVCSDLHVAWGYYYLHGYYDCNGIFINIEVENTGDYYKSESPINCILAFFVDNEETPFAALSATGYFTEYEWCKYESFTLIWFLPLEKMPDTLTVKADYTNTIPESNENNNVRTCSVPPYITIEGTIEYRQNGELVPVDADIWVVSDRYYDTYPTGHYIAHAIPFDEPDTYQLYVTPNDPRVPSDLIALKTSDPALPGETKTVDFVFSIPPNTPSKPSGPCLLKTNKEYSFSTTATEPEGEQLYYQWFLGNTISKEWVGPYESGETCEITHTWSKPIHGNIHVVARDPGGTISEGSDILPIIVMNNRGLNAPVLRFLENHPCLFLILQKIIQRLGLQ